MPRSLLLFNRFRLYESKRRMVPLYSRGFVSAPDAFARFAGFVTVCMANVQFDVGLSRPITPVVCR